MPSLALTGDLFGHLFRGTRLSAIQNQQPSARSVLHPPSSKKEQTKQLVRRMRQGVGVTGRLYSSIAPRGSDTCMRRCYASGCYIDSLPFWSRAKLSSVESFRTRMTVIYQTPVLYQSSYAFASAARPAERGEEVKPLRTAKGTKPNSKPLDAVPTTEYYRALQFDLKEKINKEKRTADLVIAITD